VLGEWVRELCAYCKSVCEEAGACAEWVEDAGGGFGGGRGGGGVLYFFVDYAGGGW
jgi:hypothetical protein